MKEYSQIQKFISVLMIFILLAYQSGCTSTKVIAKSDLPLSDSSKYAYIIHSEKSKFLLEKSTIANGILSGKINKIYSDTYYDAGHKIHLYLSSDSVIKIEMGGILSVPMNEVTKVELSEIDRGGTPFFIFISALAALVAVGFIIILTMPRLYFPL
ncbi:MAG: hypothetical protein NTY95_16260 [Bacteroidia bacterium]|jgi:hypothetical protein|nr:hypothetical protein [Bacteroidia bacterium]